MQGSSHLGYYVIIVEVGSQRLKQSLIVDTGSHMFIIPCVPCHNCGKNHSYEIYDPKKSTSYNSNYYFLQKNFDF